MGDAVVQLIKLIEPAKRALALAQNNGARANAVILAAGTQREDIAKLAARFVFVGREMALQIEALRQIMRQVADHSQGVYRQHDALAVEIERVYGDLEDAFSLLKERRVARDLCVECRALLHGTASPAPASPAEEMTLFEFVDVNSINRLKLRTTQELAAAKELRQASDTVCTELSQRIDKMADDLRVLQRPERANTTAAVTEIETAIQQQLAISDELARLLWDLGNHYEYCVGAWKRVRDGQQLPDGEMQQLQAKDGTLPAMMDNLDSRLKRIEELGARVQQRTAAYEAALAELRELFGELDDFAALLRPKLASLKSAETAFNARIETTRLNLAEFVDLVSWYDLFYDAYDWLIVEVHRRHETARQHAEVVAAMQAQLDALRADEQHRSDAFARQFGQYLPPALSVFLRDAVPEAKVVVSRAQRELPAISAEIVAEARDNIRRRTLEESKAL